jgi:hypothetical protein
MIRLGRSLDNVEIDTDRLSDRELEGLARVFAALGRDEGASPAVALFVVDLAAQLRDVAAWRAMVLYGLDFDPPVDETGNVTPAE